jgi:DNA modification methylase
MMNSFKKIEVSFRNSVPEIPSTTYGTFSIYKYPAKFIPQVIAYILKNYAEPYMKVFDPFAGYGTVGVVSRIYGCNYELWDLNPILNVIHDTAVMNEPKGFDPLRDPLKLILDIKRSDREFVPKWSNLEYWFPKEFLPVLIKAWGYVHSLEDASIKNLLLIPLLKTTRYFSYSDEKIHKLYCSKYAKQKVQNLLKRNWNLLFFNMLEGEIRLLLKKIREYRLLKPKFVEYKIKSGVDTLETNLDNEVDILITSPPYLQAQEYIRSTKLELFWLGYDQKFIKELSRKEIPYRPVEEIEIYSEKFYRFKEAIKERHLAELYDRYFHAILRAFSILGEKVKNYMFIFVGPAKVRNMPVPIDDIVAEHLKEFGWRHEVTFVDRIVSHSMFETNVNPASGLRDSRMKTEHLVVLRRCR